MKQCCIEVLIWLGEVVITELEGTESTEGITEGGTNVLPFLVGAMIGLDAVQMLYGLYRKSEVIRENERYWSDYKKNTGISPLYPNRAGAVNDYLGTALEVNQGVVSLYKKYKV